MADAEPFDLIYRFDRDGPATGPGPADPAAAVARLEAGNAEFARLMADLTAGRPGTRVVHADPADLGIPDADGRPPAQRPFAAVLGCSDARVPIELIFGQASNDIFVVRVAGNVLGAECLGSLDYALTALSRDLRVVVVLGHSGCGAVTAAVDAFLAPGRYLSVGTSHPLRAVIDKLMTPVRAAYVGLTEVYGPDAPRAAGFRAALIETAVATNAALTAATVRQEFRDRVGADREVVCGVYDLATGRVKLALEPADGVAIRLAPPPTGEGGFDALAALVAGSRHVRDMLHPADADA